MLHQLNVRARDQNDGESGPLVVTQCRIDFRDTTVAEIVVPFVLRGVMRPPSAPSGIYAVDKVTEG